MSFISFLVLWCTSSNLSAFFELFKAILRILHWSLPGPADEETFHVITLQCKITGIHTSLKINHLHGATLEGTSKLGNKHFKWSASSADTYFLHWIKNAFFNLPSPIDGLSQEPCCFCAPLLVATSFAFRPRMPCQPHTQGSAQTVLNFLA